MLKHKLNRVAAGFLSLAVTLFFTVSLFSCKSTPAQESIDILGVIDADCPLIVYIPVQSNQEFLAYAFKEIAGVEQADAEKLISRTQTAVAGCTENKGFQLGFKGSYPAIGIKSVFKEKNGWTFSHSDQTQLNFTYYEHSQYGIQAANPDSTIICASDKVVPMLSNYEAEIKRALLSEMAGEVQNILLDEKITEYLTKNENGEIRFYAQSPARFISSFLGKVTNLGLNSLAGTLANSKKENQFALKLELELSDPRTAKAVCAMLKLALFPVPAKIIQVSQSKIVITDISLTWKSLLRIITK